MRLRDVAELVLLAAIWGAAFLLMRMGAGQFGPAALAGVRVTGAALCLLPLLALRGQMHELRRHWRPIFVVGIINSALPFLLFSYAALSISAGLASIFNSTSPLFGAVVAWLWLKDRLTPMRVLGLALGFAGVLWLAWDKASFKPGGTGWAIVACLCASALYGLGASYAKRHLGDIAPLAVATGSQVSAALALLLPAALFWPSVAPAQSAWVAAALLAVVCTGLAYILYFRLIANAGAANAIAVTFLVPVFAVLWGALFLGEAVTLSMLIGGAVILLGTGLTTGLLKWPVAARA